MFLVPGSNSVGYVYLEVDNYFSNLEYIANNLIMDKQRQIETKEDAKKRDYRRLILFDDDHERFIPFIVDTPSIGPSDLSNKSVCNNKLAYLVKRSFFI